LKALLCIIGFSFITLSLSAQIAPGLLDIAGPALNSRAAVLMDAETGAVLYAKNPDEKIPPASLTNLMTIHLVLKEIAAGRASLDEIITPPRESWAVNQPPRSSLMHLAEGQSLSLRELILGMAIPSGNDAAVAAALRFSPTVQGFVDLMNAEAQALGLEETHFVEPAGISEDNMTTAMEYTAFCREYITRHPESLRDFHSVMELAYPQAANVAPERRSTVGIWRQRNHNSLLTSFAGTDGLKTGYIDEAGYNIALTAERQDTRFIAVILGAPAVYGGDRLRDEDGLRLFSWAFENFKTLRPLIGGIEPARLWKGKAHAAEFIPGETPDFTIPANRGAKLWISTEIEDPLIAPIPAHYRVGDIIISDDAGELRRIPLLTAKEYPQGNIFKRIWDSVQLFFKNLFS
jgi:D-alanyl-D-alanine carboxypeptidase (penicillin-binding protein 5/6)